MNTYQVSGAGPGYPMGAVRHEATDYLYYTAPDGLYAYSLELAQTTASFGISNDTLSSGEKLGPSADGVYLLADQNIFLLDLITLASLNSFDLSAEYATLQGENLWPAGSGTQQYKGKSLPAKITTQDGFVFDAFDLTNTPVTKEQITVDLGGNISPSAVDSRDAIVFEHTSTTFGPVTEISWKFIDDGTTTSSMGPVAHTLPVDSETIVFYAPYPSPEYVYFVMPSETGNLPMARMHIETLTVSSIWDAGPSALPTVVSDYKDLVHDHPAYLAGDLFFATNVLAKLPLNEGAVLEIINDSVLSDTYSRPSGFPASAFSMEEND